MNATSSILLNKKVLLVEDTGPMRRLLEKTLTTEGAVVTSAPNGEDGLQSLQEADLMNEPFHLVLLDFMMPGMSGLDVLKVMRETSEFKDLPVVMMTARNDRKTVVACARFNVQGYIVKPFNVAHLLETLGKALPAEAAGGEDAS